MVPDATKMSSTIFHLAYALSVGHFLGAQQEIVTCHRARGSRLRTQVSFVRLFIPAILSFFIIIVAALGCGSCSVRAAHTACGFSGSLAKSFSCFLSIAFELNSTNLAGPFSSSSSSSSCSTLTPTSNLLALHVHMNYWRSSSSTTTRDTRRIASETLSCRPVFPLSNHLALSCSTKDYPLLRYHSPTCTHVGQRDVVVVQTMQTNGPTEQVLFPSYALLLIYPFSS
jgi:hypothetical protein